MASTVREIAEMADVSIGTVSRALRYEPGVSESCAVKVREIAQRLNYLTPMNRPPRRRLTVAETAAAQPLHGKSVAMLVLGMERSLASLPIVADALHGTEASVAAAGGMLIFIDCPDPALMPPALEQQPLAGVVLVGAYEGDLLMSRGRKLMEKIGTLPTVWLLGRPNGIEWGDAVGADNPAVGRIGADYLLSRGHRRLAFLSTVRLPNHPLVSLRQWSFESRARAAGVTVDLVAHSDDRFNRLPLPATSMEEVEPAVDRLLALSPRPTGVMVAFDSLAAAAHRALLRRGVAIGREMEIISCNNERPLIAPLNPPVATIDIHANLIGRKAVEMLAWRCGRAAADAPPMTLSIAPRLVAAEV